MAPAQAQGGASPLPKRVSFSISRQLYALGLEPFEGRQHSGIDVSSNPAYRPSSHANAHARTGTAGRAEHLQTGDRARTARVAARAQYPHQPEPTVALDGKAREGS